MTEPAVDRMTLPRDGAVDEPSKTPEVAASASPVSHLSTSSSVDPRVEALVNDLIGRVADKWTMLILDLLAEKGELRFSQIGREIGTISQKMLTQTLRQMERDGLVRRTIHPVIPPRVDYRLTTLGLGLGEAFCGVWLWAEANLAAVDEARRRFDAAKTG